jgi:hypothetical protein
MDFLLDVNASGAVARWLIDRGHNVAEVGQKDPSRHSKDLESGAIVIALRAKFRVRKRG